MSEPASDTATLFAALPPLRTVGKRILAMTLLWGLFGAWIGATSVPPRQGLIGVVSFVIAGMIVMPAVGVVLGLLGSPVKETLAGAALGWFAGAALGTVSGLVDPFLLANTGLIGGGIAGATVATLLNLARRFAAAGLLRQRP